MIHFPLYAIKRIAAIFSIAATLIAAPMVTSTSTAGLADLLFGVSVQEGCTQFTSPYGAPVPVQYYLPNSNCPSPAVIILHGSDGGTRYGKDYAEIGKGLAAKGYAAFLVYYYEGAPGAIRPGPNDRTLPDPNSFVPWVATTDQAISFVQSFPGVDPARVGILGMSLGGFVGTSASANDPRVRSLAILSGGMPDQYAAKMAAMPPTLIIHGDQDCDVPVTEAYKLHDRMARKGLWHDLQILPCEGHLPYRSYKQCVAEKVLSFFDQTL